jgi:plastocyanin
MRRTTILAVLATLLVTAPAWAGGTTVNLGNNFFDPDNVLLSAPGQQVTWEWPNNSNFHNVRQDKKLFYSGDATTNANASFTRTFSAGTFHYYCEVHAPSMDGLVRVKPSIDKAPSGDNFTVIWATSGSNTGNVFDVQYKVGTGDWTTWKTDTSQDSDVFGDGGDPVNVQAGTKYTFRARSQKNDDANSKVSKYSPKRSFTPGG